MTAEEKYFEIQQAIEAANRALLCLDQADDFLSSARNWGALDLLGGNLITGIMKHKKMNDSSQQLESARHAVQTFSRELSDVTELDDVNLNTDDFWGFADFFLDGVISDWMMQSRIHQAQAQVESARQKIRRIRGELKDMLNMID